MQTVDGEGDSSVTGIEMCRFAIFPRGQRPRARTETPRAGTGRSQVHPGPQSFWDALGSLRTYADDERTWEIGQACSTGEVPEQSRATGSGGEGGKRSGQREPATAKRVPDTEPD